jgi:2-amino-4-hydroxy-6-hydroxymethyldihydropteridine diphosphokinase
MRQLTHTAFLGLGSNLGDRKANIEEAIRRLGERGIRLIRASPVYQTEPVDFVRQGWFLNLVVRTETRLLPINLLRLCQAIEASLGRERTIHRGPRIIDLDILFYDDLILSEPNLKIPHPRLHLRRFVLIPLSDIARDLVHPVLHQSIGDLLNQCSDRAQVSPYVENAV